MLLTLAFQASFSLIEHHTEGDGTMMLRHDLHNVASISNPSHAYVLTWPRREYLGYMKPLARVHIYFSILVADVYNIAGVTVRNRHGLRLQLGQ